MLFTQYCDNLVPCMIDPPSPDAAISSRKSPTYILFKIFTFAAAQRLRLRSGHDHVSGTSTVRAAQAFSQYQHPQKQQQFIQGKCMATLAASRTTSIRKSQLVLAVNIDVDASCMRMLL